MPLTQKQTEYLALAWQCFESEPKIDYEKFATLAGLKNAASAREMIRVTKKALFAGNASHGGTPTKSSATKGDDAETPASGKKRATPGSGRGKKKGAVVAGEDDVEGERSPRKRAKKEKKGADVVKEEPKDEDEDGDGEMFGDVIFT